MGEIKSVKVDNWGVFFLQKLQNFFNKTDYCDLTLQFNDNSQLKVHKLVLSACTDYFNVLEQTCEMIDDILIMPNELQADLVVPIVNFMYTGTLEFELKMYGKLLKTARDMNMTVLLKLLEAHRRTMEGTKQVVRNTKTSPRQTYLNAGIKPVASIPTIIETSSSNTVQAKRRILSTKIEPYRKLQIKPISSSTYSDTNTILTKYPNTKVTPIKGPSRFEYEGENILQDTFESSFDAISYESKPLKEEILDDDDNQHHNMKQESTTSLQFEQLRRTGYNNNKRPAQSILQSPPTKKPNIQDVKEYAEQQRMRKQIAEEYGEEFEDTLDDEFHNADDDEEYNISTPIPVTSKPILTKSTSNLKQKSQQQNQINKRTTTIGKQEEKPRIVVKDSTSSNVDHAKIISEVLRKYPHLIKNNKNIKLKIMPNASGNGGPQRVVIKKDADTIISPPPTPSTSKTAIATGLQDAKSLKVSAQQKIIATGSSAQLASTTEPPTGVAKSSSSQPRRIDSKTMKALISLGAENTTGPWLCLRCGVNGRPISIPSYRGFRRHLTNTHKEKIDPRLCAHCGWRSTAHKELLFHIQMEHQIKCNLNFPKCEHCSLVVLDLAALDDHIDEAHSENKEENQQCIYCNKTFSTEILLYNHMKAQHKERARDDGVIDFSDDEHTGEFGDDDDDNVIDYESTNQKLPSSSKIQILSDINLPKCISLTKTPTDLSAITLEHQQQSITTTDTTILGNIDYITASSTDTGPKFVNAEGNVMELTPAQRDEIISQLEQSGDGVVMVLNDESFVNDDKIADIADSTTGKIQTIASQEFGDNNMLIVYDDQQQSTRSEKIIQDENKEEKRLSKDDDEKEDGDADDEEMEWKNDVSQDEIDKSTPEELVTDDNIQKDINEKKETNDDNLKTKKQDKDSSDLDMKLKLLTGDWTEDEDDDDECQDISDEKEDKKDKTGGDDKILDILEKNNDSPDITAEKIKLEVKEPVEDEHIETKSEIQEPKDEEENENISDKTDADINEINLSKDDTDEADNQKNIDSEENFKSYTEDYDKDEEILYSAEIGDYMVEEKTVEETDQQSNTIENDDNNKIVTATIESDTKENTENIVKKVQEDSSEDINNKIEIKESDKSSVVEDITAEEERGGSDNDDDDDGSKKEDKAKTESVPDDNIMEKIEDDEKLNKSDKDNKNEELVTPATTTTECKDEIDETKTKDEIKNLISEWGEDDDDL